MGAALVLLLVGLGAMAAGVLIGRYYVPDDRQLRRTARHSKAYMRALSYLIARDHDTAVSELRTVVEENIDDVEPYFALGAMFRSRGEHERAIRVHQALAMRERDRKKLRQRAMFELGLDFRAAGMPRRATRAMEEVLLEEPSHETALRVLAALYEEQGRFHEAAGLWARIGKAYKEDTAHREHHLLVAAAQAALAREDLDSAKQLLKGAHKHAESAHFFAAAAELAAAKGNHRGAKERLVQALVAEPALAPHLLPGLVTAEQGLAASDRGGRGAAKAEAADDLDEESADASATRGELEGGDRKLLESSADKAPATEGAAASSEGATGSSEGAAAAAGEGSATTSKPAAASSSGSSTSGGGALVSSPSSFLAAATSALAARVKPATTPPLGTPLVAAKPPPTIAERVLAVLADVEAQTGPRLELALIRAQLMPPADAAASTALAQDLVARFPDALAARVAVARLALASADAASIRTALATLVADDGSLSWALRGRWQCSNCGHRPGPFTWRCGQCRRWNTLRMETGVEPPPIPPRERRTAPRPARPEGLLGATPDHSLPAPTLDAGLTEDELAQAGTRRSLLGRVGGWFSGAFRRDRR